MIKRFKPHDFGLPRLKSPSKPMADRSFGDQLRSKRVWQKLRSMKLDETPLCETCGGPARDVHHIEPIELAPEKALVMSNLKALCVNCHQEEHR